MASHVRRTFAEAYGTVPEEYLLELVKSARERAERRGFVTEVQIVRFIDLWLYFGEEFGEGMPGSWWTVIFEQAGLDADQKLDALEEQGLREL